MRWRPATVRRAIDYWLAFRDRHGNAWRLVCLARGCHYDTPAFCPAYCLYFCTRCKKELIGRELAELERMPAIPDDVREQLDSLDEHHDN